jgi:hypothetical protein
MPAVFYMQRMQVEAGGELVEFRARGIAEVVPFRLVHRISIQSP